MKLLTLPDIAILGPRVHGFFEDFDHVVSADRWTSVLTDSGTANVGDAAGGVLPLIPSDGTVADNDEAYLHTTAELFKFADDKPLILDAYVQFTEANTDDANILVGLMDAVAADHLQDNGAGPAASYSGAVFYKADGGTVWVCENSIGATQKTTTTATTAGGGYQKLSIEVYPFTSTKMDIVFKVDDVEVAKHKDQSMASATEMQAGFGVQNGSVNNLETLNCDYFSCWQLR